MIEKRQMVRWIYGVVAAMALMGGSLFLSSCEDDSERSGNDRRPKGAMVTVDFALNEISFDETVGSDPAPRSASSSDFVAVSGSESVVRIADDLYMYSYVAEEVAPVRLRVSMLNPGANVRIVAYELRTSPADTVYVDHADYKALANDYAVIPDGPSLMVPSGVNYLFVAYSFNDTGSLGAFADSTGYIVNTRDALWGATAKVITTDHDVVTIGVSHLFALVNVQVSVPANGSIHAISSATVDSYDSARLVIKNGKLALDPAIVLKDFPVNFLSSGIAPIWASDELLVYPHPTGSTGVRVANINIDGQNYAGPYHIPYTPILQGGHFYTLFVRFLRPTEDFAPRITWDSANRRYAITYDPTDAGLYFKHGSVVGIFSTEGAVQDLRPPITGGTGFQLSRDTVWNPTRNHPNPPIINSWATIPYATGYIEHNGDSVRVGLGDPCRLVGLNLDSIVYGLHTLNPFVDNGRWRMPTAAENQAFADTYDWQTATDVIGGLFTSSSGLEQYFLPAAGYRNSSGTVTDQGVNGSYWAAALPPVSAAWSIIAFTNASMNNHVVNHSTLDAYPVRCVYDPRVIFEAKPWEYEQLHNNSAPGDDPVWIRYDSYLLDGSTYTIKVYSNTTWQITNVEGEIYRPHGHAARGTNKVYNMRGEIVGFTPQPFTTNAMDILEPQQKPGDNLISSWQSGTIRGQVGDNITVEDINFTVKKDGGAWGRLKIKFQYLTPASSYEIDSVQVVFALPRMKMLSIASTGLGNASYGLAHPYLGQINPFNIGGQTYGLNNARRMIDTHANFGFPDPSDPNDNPIVYTRGIDVEHQTSLPSAGNIPARFAGFDVVQLGYNQYPTTPNENTAIFNYVNNGGVLLAAIETGTSNLVDFIRDMFPEVTPSSQITTGSGNSGGAVYEIVITDRFGAVVDDMINNGAFADLTYDPIAGGRARWGEDNTTTRCVNFPSGANITAYSYAVNVSGGNANNPSCATIWKHNARNFFFMGDGGFAATPSNANNSETSTYSINSRSSRTFMLDPITYFPIPKRPHYDPSHSHYLWGFGDSNTPASIRYPVYNSGLFGNMIVWAMTRVAEEKYK